MSGHPQAKFASPVLLGIALGIGLVVQGRGTVVNALGASLGLVLASLLFASIAIGLFWVASIIISRKSFSFYIWANTAAGLTLLLTLLFVVFSPSVAGLIDFKAMSFVQSFAASPQANRDASAQHDAASWQFLLEADADGEHPAVKVEFDSTSLNRSGAAVTVWERWTFDPPASFFGSELPSVAVVKRLQTIDCTTLTVQTLARIFHASDGKMIDWSFGSGPVEVQTPGTKYADNAQILCDTLNR